MGGMSGAVQEIGDKKAAVDFAVGSTIDTMGFGALTGTGPMGASTIHTALGQSREHGGVLKALKSTAKDIATSLTPSNGDSEMFSQEGMENFAPDGGSEMFEIDHSGPSFFEQHTNDFFDGLTKNGSTFVVDENGDWDPTRSLAKGAGRFVQNKIDNIGKKKLLDKNFAEQEMKRMMAQYMGQ